MFVSRLRSRGLFSTRLTRTLATLSNNPEINVFPLKSRPGSYLLSYLDTNPPSFEASIGVTSELPPTPRSFEGNAKFLAVLNEVLGQYAFQDEDLKAQAKVFASPGGSSLGQNTGAAGAATSQGGPGGAGVGGWIHLSDSRNPPDFGRIAWPEDIFGSVEVDGHGDLRENFQPSGTYRVVTNEGILGLTPFLREKLVARLREIDRENEQRVETSE